MKRLALCALMLAGCYRTRFELQPPVGYATPSPLYTDHFHFSLINIIELSAPVDLAAACGGVPPAAIDENIGVLGGIVNILTSYAFPIIHVHNATVLCPAGNGPGPMGPPPMSPPPMGPGGQ
jgi:hypothetical protein